MRIAISTSSFSKSDPTALMVLKRMGAETRENPFGHRLTEAEIIEHLDGIDGLIAGLESLNQRVLSSAGDLKAIARVGIGMANVDMEAAKEMALVQLSRQKEMDSKILHVKIMA